MYLWALIFITQYGGAFCQLPFRWISYYGSSKSTGKETGKTHLCVVEEGRGWRLPAASSLNVYTVSHAIHSSTL